MFLCNRLVTYNSMFLQKTAIAVAMLTIAACGVGASFSETPTSSVGIDPTAAPSTLVQHEATTTTTTTVPATTTTQPTVAPQAVPSADPRELYGRCGEWYEPAVAIGWPEEEWPILSKVLYRESRCQPDAYNGSDPASGSRGLLQINGYWCRPSKWTEAGWLQDRGVLSACDELYDPVVNLRAGLLIWLYGEQKHGCGWRGPWATSC